MPNRPPSWLPRGPSSEVPGLSGRTTAQIPVSVLPVPAPARCNSERAPARGRCGCREAAAASGSLFPAIQPCPSGGRPSPAAGPVTGAGTALLGGRGVVGDGRLRPASHVRVPLLPVPEDLSSEEREELLDIRRRKKELIDDIEVGWPGCSAGPQLHGPEHRATSLCATETGQIRSPADTPRCQGPRRLFQRSLVWLGTDLWPVD